MKKTKLVIVSIITVVSLILCSFSSTVSAQTTKSNGRAFTKFKDMLIQKLDKFTNNSDITNKLQYIRNATLEGNGIEPNRVNLIIALIFLYLEFLLLLFIVLNLEAYLG